MHPRALRVAVATALILPATLATAAGYPGGARPFEHCLEAVAERVAGRVLKVEARISEGGPLIYEFAVRDAGGRDWDVACEADRAEVIEVELEVASVGVPAFARALRVDEAAARAAAGEGPDSAVREVEYEVEDAGAGRAVYEFDLVDPAGAERKIEVDAESGGIVETSRELWQVGYE